MAEQIKNNKILQMQTIKNIQNELFYCNKANNKLKDDLTKKHKTISIWKRKHDKLKEENKILNLKVACHNYSLNMNIPKEKVSNKFDVLLDYSKQLVENKDLYLEKSLNPEDIDNFFQSMEDLNDMINDSKKQLLGEK